MGNAWYVSPLTAEEAESLAREGVSVPDEAGPSTAPTPAQVFATLESFPEYLVAVRRRDRKDKGQSVSIELRRADGSYAIDICVYRVSSDDWPVGTFVFEHYGETDELVRLVSRLADVCGPLVLWNDSGCERSILVSPGAAPT
jgi:hypothetical protein